jgi:hypothetical protein
MVIDVVTFVKMNGSVSPLSSKARKRIVVSVILAILGAGFAPKAILTSNKH